MRKLSRIYLIIGAIIAICLLLYGLKYPTHLYSPGDLAKAHEKIAECKECHQPFKGVESSLCLNGQCHPINKITDTAKTTGGLHAKVKEKDCTLCHTEHRGLAGRITIKFDHELLEADIKLCFSCHKVDADKAHPEKYGRDCMLCHTTKTWKVAPIEHRKFVKIACAECHRGPVDELHRDAGNLCQECHTTEKWSPATFEHIKYFPITGDHKASCIKCHEGKIFKKYTCLGCHEHNTRKIRSEHLEEGVKDYADCLRCHSFVVDGRRYGTAKIDIEDDD